MTEFVIKVLQRSQLSHSESDIKHFIYIHSKWLEDLTELDFLVTTSNANYRATLKHDEIKSAAEELEQPYNEVFEECKKALCTQMGLPGFDYYVDEQEAHFKLFKCTGYETLYLDIPLRNASNCYQLLNASIEIAQRQPTVDAEQNSSSQSEADAGSKYKELLAEYEHFIEHSRLTEKKLLKKFILLINSKKERIEELERMLHERRNTAPDTDSDAEERLPVASPNKRKDVNEEGDYTADTQVLTQIECMQD